MRHLYHIINPIALQIEVYLENTDLADRNQFH